MTLACKVCGTVLTTPLRKLEDLSLLSQLEGQPFVPAGYFHVLPESEPHGKRGDIAVAIPGTIGLKKTTDMRRLAGCRGLDGLDGLNQLCPNGHEVATEKSDCWMPHGVVFASEAVTVCE